MYFGVYTIYGIKSQITVAKQYEKVQIVSRYCIFHAMF